MLPMPVSDSLPSRLKRYPVKLVFFLNESVNTCPWINLTPLKKAHITSVLRIILKRWNGCTLKGRNLNNMLSWHHSGFNVYIGGRIEPDDKVGLGNLARYIIGAC